LLLAAALGCAGGDDAAPPINAGPIGMTPAAGTGTPPAPIDAGPQTPARGADASSPVDAGPPRPDGAPAIDAGPPDASGAPDAASGGAGTSSMPRMDAATPNDAAPEDAAPPGDAAMGGEPDAAPGDDDRCDDSVLDPSRPPATLMLSGATGTHDPTVIESNGVYYLWNTGPRIPAKTSPDLRQWRDAPAAFGSGNPAWVAREVPGATDLWAPDVSFFGGQFHLYYSASTWGSNSSCIGHATRPSLESGSWQDQGSVVCSNHGSRDDWNAIDPNVVVDAEGTPWLSFGSFWSGIKAIELDMSGARANDDLHSLATRPRDVEGAVEAPVIVRRCGYYYLFVSFDKCCSGVDSTYNIRIGRSENVIGPYLDREGKSLLQGGGSLLVMGNSRFHGPGHNSVLFTEDGAYNIYHSYDGQQNGRATLRVSELRWNDTKWPVSGGP